MFNFHYQLERKTIATTSSAAGRHQSTRRAVKKSLASDWRNVFAGTVWHTCGGNGQLEPFDVGQQGFITRFAPGKSSLKSTAHPPDRNTSCCRSRLSRPTLRPGPALPGHASGLGCATAVGGETRPRCSGVPPAGRDPSAHRTSVRRSSLSRPGSPSHWSRHAPPNHGRGYRGESNGRRPPWPTR